MEIAKTEEEARTLLRERYLRCMSNIIGSDCEMQTIENTSISGKYSGIDIHGQEILVKNLLTPTGETMNAALVRTCDISCLTIKNINPSSLESLFQ